VGLREVFAPASLVVVGIVAACGWLTYIAVYLLQPATAMERHAALDVARLTASFLGRMRIGGVAAK
ncbi:MAG TPA: hypothetical protein VIV06_11755, partial [Candidatus Limnocylindrales bacterium]